MVHVLVLVILSDRQEKRQASGADMVLIINLSSGS